MISAVSFNTNSIRQRLHQLQKVIDEHAPDFIGIQETKVTDADFPNEAIKAMGYHVEYFGQKTHYGVALLSRLPFLKVIKGFPDDTEEAQKRFIGGQFDSPFGGQITVLNGYFPQGERQDHPVKFANKENFYRDLQRFLTQHYSPDEQMIIMGDMNISPEDIDVGIGENNRKRWLKDGKCSFLPVEREWLNTLYSWGLQDTYRYINKDKEEYSWFDYRSRGFEREPRRGLRIDLILATEQLIAKCHDAGINYEIRAMEKPSDHCPIWAAFR